MSHFFFSGVIALPSLGFGPSQGPGTIIADIPGVQRGVNIEATPALPGRIAAGSSLPGGQTGVILNLVMQTSSLLCVVAASALLGACADDELSIVSGFVDVDNDVVLTDGGPPDISDTSVTPEVDVHDIALPDLSEPDIAEVAEDTATPPPICPFEPWDEGLIGGRVERIAFDPRAPGVAWIAASVGLMRSIDGGQSVEPRATGIGVTAMAFPPDDPKRILTISGGGLAESIDGGVTLKPLSLSGLRLTALAVSSAQPTRVWVGTDGGGVLRSDNGGTGFSPANIGVPYGQIFAIAASPTAADVAIAGFAYRNEANLIQNQGGLLRTADAGRTWTLVSDDVRWGNEVVFCPTDGNIAYAAVRRGILGTTDGGLTWTRLPFLETRDTLDVAFGAGGCDTLWVSVYQDAIYRIDVSTRRLTGPLRNGLQVERSRFNVTVAPSPIDPQLLIVASPAGVFRSVDGGFTFAPAPGPATLAMNNLAAPLDGSGLVLLGTSGSGLWARSSDTPWRRVPTLPFDNVSGVSGDPTSADRFALYTTAGSFATDSGPDGLFQVPPPFQSLTHAIWRPNLGDMLLTTQTRGVHRSTDGGRTVVQMNEGLAAWPTPNGTFIDTRWLLRDPADSEGLLMGTRGRGVAIWDPAEARWQLVDNELARDEVYQLFRAGEAVYARVLGKGVLRSDDGARSWQPVMDGLDTGTVVALAYDALGDRLFATADGALHVLAGASSPEAAALRWRQLGRGCLPEETRLGPMTVAEDPVAGPQLVVGASGNRIFRVSLAPGR